MVRERFEDSFERLREQSNRLANTERTADNFDEIVAERVKLDRLRDEVTSERKNIVSRFEPPATDFVEPPRGYLHTNLAGKIGAAIGVLLLAVAGFAAFTVVQAFNRNFPLELVEVIETVEIEGRRCSWSIEATVRNDSDEQVQIEQLEVVLNRRMHRAVGAELPRLDPGQVGIARASWNLLSSGECVGVDEISHNNLIFSLDNGLTVSRGF